MCPFCGANGSEVGISTSGRFWLKVLFGPWELMHLLLVKLYKLEHSHSNKFFYSNKIFKIEFRIDVGGDNCSWFQYYGVKWISKTLNKFLLHPSKIFKYSGKILEILS